MQLSIFKTYLKVLLILLCTTLLINCSSTSRIKPVAKQHINSVDICLLVNEQDTFGNIYEIVDKDSAIAGGAAGGGILGALLIGAIAEGMEESRKDEREIVRPVYDLYNDYNLEKHLKVQVQQELPAVKWFDIVKIDSVYLSQYQIKNIYEITDEYLSESKADAVMFINVSTHFISNYNALNIIVETQMFPNPDDSKLKKSINYYSDTTINRTDKFNAIYDKTYSFKDSVGNALLEKTEAVDLWAANDGSKLLLVLNDRVNDIAQMIVTDMNTD